LGICNQQTFDSHHPKKTHRSQKQIHLTKQTKTNKRLQNKQSLPFPLNQKQKTACVFWVSQLTASQAPSLAFSWSPQLQWWCHPTQSRDRRWINAAVGHIIEATEQLTPMLLRGMETLKGLGNPWKFNMGVFLKLVGFPPKSSIFNGVSHYVHHPFWGKKPYFWFNTHMEPGENGVQLWKSGESLNY